MEATAHITTTEAKRGRAVAWPAVLRALQLLVFALSAFRGLRGLMEGALLLIVGAAAANLVDTLPPANPMRGALVAAGLAVADPPQHGPVPPPGADGTPPTARTGDLYPESGRERTRRVRPLRRASILLGGVGVPCYLVCLATGWRAPAVAGLVAYIVFLTAAPGLRERSDTPREPRRAPVPVELARALRVPEGWYTATPPRTVPSAALVGPLLLALAAVVGPGPLVRAVDGDHSVDVAGGYRLTLSGPARPGPTGGPPSPSPAATSGPAAASPTAGAGGTTAVVTVPSSPPPSPGTPPPPDCARAGEPQRRIAEGPEPPAVRQALQDAYSDAGWPSVGCVYALPVMTPGGWRVSTQSAYNGTTDIVWLRGRAHLVFDAYVVPESRVPGLIDVSDRTSLGAGDLQMTTGADGSCRVFERQASEPVVEMPADVARLVASIGERHPAEFPLVTGVDYSGEFETFTVTLVRPAPQRPGYAAESQATVTLDVLSGQVTAAGYEADPRIGCGNLLPALLSEAATVQASTRRYAPGS